MHALKDKAAIAGIGWTSFTKDSGASVLSLATEACKKAIDDAGLNVKEIDGIVTHNMSDSVMPQEVATCLGLPGLGYHLEYWGGGPAGCQHQSGPEQADGRQSDSRPMMMSTHGGTLLSPV